LAVSPSAVLTSRFGSVRDLERDANLEMPAGRVGIGGEMRMFSPARALG
jgi:hypothetical protein